LMAVRQASDGDERDGDNWLAHNVKLASPAHCDGRRCETGLKAALAQ